MKKESIIQFIKFGLVGVSNTIISYLVYYVLIKLNLFYLIASIFSFVAGVLNSFYWNNKYVFKHKNGQREILKTLTKTFVAYAGTGLILNNVLLVIWVQGVGIGELIAPIINLPITTFINFVANKYWAYRNKS